MFSYGRCLLLLTVASLPLTSCEVVNLACDCTQNSNRSVSVELTCTRNTDSFLDLSCDRADVGAIPDGYKHVEGCGLYKLYQPVLIWEDAKDFCALEGGRLAIPKDKKSFATLSALLAQETDVSIAWLGVNDLDVENFYVGVDGKPARYLPWRENQPDHFVDGGGIEEHCVEMNTEGVNDIHCRDLASFICEIPVSPALQDYTWVEGASRFVKLHTDNQIYSSAQSICESEGGTLATLETWDRVQAVLRVLPRVSGGFFVGFSDAEEEGTFVTATGRKLSDMQFANWDKDQPDGAERQNCVTLGNTGTYSDIDCNTPWSYLCEVTRPSTVR